MTLAPVHIVSKADNTNHATCTLEQHPSPLLASSIRVRTHLIALTSNNLSYARGGAIPLLHWWDAYPVPETCPPPYNNRDAWGIVPAWGYGVVTDSAISAIRPGSLLWGFLPASGHAVQLQLEPGALEGHWRETSAERSKLMTVYNHYEQANDEDEKERQLKVLCFPLWSGPNLLNGSTFSERHIHPLGAGLAWSAEDADLASAVVVSLSASSKTGRSLAWELARNRDTAAHGPRALVQLTSAPDTLAQFATKLPVQAAPYTELSHAVDWIANYKP